MNKIKTRKEIERDPNLIIPIVADDIFKIVFGREENADITAYLVSLLLKIPYEKVKGKVKFKSNSHNKQRASEKNSEKDIVFLIDTSEPLKINLEMNKTNYLEQPIIERNVYYFSNLFGSGLKRKNEYEDLKTTIQYNFNLKYVDEIGEELIDEYLYRNQRGNVLTEKSKIVHINIKEMANLWYSNEYNKFKEISPILFGLSALILETDKKKFEELVESIKMDKDIKEQLERIVMDLNIDDELVTKYYDLDEEREKRDKAVYASLEKRLTKQLKEKYEQQFKEEGAEQNKKEIVLNMYNQNMDIKDISKFTNLSTDMINKIINENTCSRD